MNPKKELLGGLWASYSSAPGSRALNPVRGKTKVLKGPAYTSELGTQNLSIPFPGLHLAQSLEYFGILPMISILFLFWFTQLYIYDPIRQPQTGTTMETIHIGCSLPVVSKNGVNAGPPPWTPNHHASPYVQTRIAISAPSCFGKSINLHDATQS